MTLKNTNSTLKIKSLQHIDGSDQYIESVCDSSFFETEDKIIVFYAEKLDDDNKSDSVLKFDNKTLNLKRRGTYSCDMTFRQGTGSKFLYKMPYGCINMSIYTKQLRLIRRKNMVIFEIKYDLFQDGETQQNEITIEINY